MDRHRQHDINTDRPARVSAIRDAAVVCASIGITAHHDLLSDGRHRIAIYDRAAGELREWTADTVQQAIQAARDDQGHDRGGPRR